MSEFVFDLQRFADDSAGKTDLDASKLLNDIIAIIEPLGLIKLSGEWILKGSDVLIEWTDDNVNPVLKFIATFLKDKIVEKTGTETVVESLNIIAQAISILAAGNEISKELKKEKPSATEITSKIGSIVSSMTLVTKSADNLDNSGKNSFLLSVVSAGIGLVASLVAGADGIDEDEKDKIYSSYVLLLKSVGSEIVKKFFSASIDAELSKIDLDDVLKNSGILNKVIRLDDLSDAFTKGGGFLDLIFSVITGVLTAVNKYDENLKKYTADGIPSNISKHDAFIDAVGKFVHDTASTYSKGLDDVLFKGIQGIVSFFTGTEAYDPDKNYVEVICDRFKVLSPLKNTAGRIGDDDLVACNNSSMLYTGDGNDHIGITAAGDTIWAGHGDDTLVITNKHFEDFSSPFMNLIYGGPGDDVFSFYGSRYDTIYGGTGNDSIAIFGASNKLFGDDGDDVFILKEDSTDTTVEGGRGNDTIDIEKSEYIVIRYEDGDGKDVIFGFNEKDKLEISGEYSLFTNGEDVIVKVGDGSVLLRQAAGQKININGNTYTEIQTGTAPEIPSPVKNLPGFDEFHERVNPVTEITGTEKADDIRNGVDHNIGVNGITDTKNNLAIQGLGGNDTLVNYTGTNVSMDGGTGDDTLLNAYGQEVVLDGGPDNDVINNHASFVTITGGDGNDEIFSISLDSLAPVHHHVKIYGGAGDDKIGNSGEETTIYGGSGNDQISNVSKWNGTADSVVIFGETGNDNFTNNGNNVKIYGGEDDDKIGNTSGSDVLLDGGTGNDSIVNTRGTNIVMKGGDGNDTLGNGGSFVTMTGGNGNDIILTFAMDGVVNSHVKINAGSGHDLIISDSEEVTINSGADNDSIHLEGNAKNNLIEYSSGGGNDSIFGFNGDDTLSISGGDYSTQISGNDILVNVGDGSILLKDANGLNLNIIGTYKTETIPPDTTPADTTPPDTTPADTTLTITNADKSPVTLESSIEVVDASARTKAVKITGNELDNTITGGKGNDTLDGGNGDDLLTGGNGADVFILSTGNDTITDFGTGNDKISIGSAQIKDFSANGSDFVFEFEDGSLTLTDAASKKISVTGKTTQIYDANGIFNSAGTAVTLNSSIENFTANSKLVTIDAGLTSNTTITGNSKANKISLGNENVFIWSKGGNDTILNFGTDDTLSIVGSVSDGTLKSGDTYLKIGSNKITVKDSAQITFTDNDGTKIFDDGIFYDEDKISATLTTAVNKYTATENVTNITGNAKANTLTGSVNETTLTGGKGNDLFINAGGNDFITDYGTGSDKISLGSSLESFSVTDSNVELELVKGSVTIANGAGKKISLVSGGKTTANIFSSNGIFSSAGTAVTLNASAKNFTANSKLVTIDAGLTSNATITGNSKANKISLGDENVFIWSKGGNDTLENFGEDDTLKISGSVSDASVKGGNTYIKIGSNKITVKDSAQVTFTDNDGTKIFDDGIFYDEDKFSATLGSAVKDFTATENITDITGNTKANKLYAGTEDTTLTGGKGNDSLWGGDGSDKFIYNKGDGKDVIFGFGSDDLLEIIGLNGEVTGKFNSAGNELTVKVGNTSVALLKDFGSTTTFNVTANGTAHQITK